MNMLHAVVDMKRRRHVRQNPHITNGAVLNRFHVISSGDHELLAGEGVSIVIAEPDLEGESIAESVDTHIECFRSARELINLQIEALEREQEEEEKHMCVFARSNSFHV